MADHSWRQTNHIWSDDELAERMATANEKHVPETLSDRLMQGIMRFMYWSFNTVTGYREENPTAQSIE